MATSDGQLVRRSWGGDQAAFDELVRRHRAAVQAFACRLTRDPAQAEDLAQEVFVRAYVHLGKLRDPERLRAWLFAIARSVCVSRIQADAIRRRLDDGRALLFEPLPPTPEEEFQRREAAREARRLLDGLPEPYRTPLERHYLQGRSHSEIARELGVALGTVKARVHHAKRKLGQEVVKMSRDWHGKCEWPEEREPTMTLDQLARAALRRYDLGSFEGLGAIYQPHESIGVGVQTTKGRYRLWRYHGWMTPELVELQHAMLQHLAEKGVPVKRAVSARDGTTWQEVRRQLVAVFEWFGGWQPEPEDRRELAMVAKLHARWTLAMADFDPPIKEWRRLASQWRPRKGSKWVLPTEELPRVPTRMGFFAAARDIENPPPHHEKLLAQVRDTEARLRRFAEKGKELKLSDLPRGMNHGVFMLGLIDWEVLVTDADDFQYEARVADLARLLWSIHTRDMPSYQRPDLVMLILDTYREHVELSPEEVRALPILAWGQGLYYDAFNILLYLQDLDTPDRGEYYVGERIDEWTRERDQLETELEELTDFVSHR